MTIDFGSGDKWGQWGQPMNTLAQRVPTVVPITFRLGTRAAQPEAYCPHHKLLGDREWGRFNPNEYGPVPIVPSCPQGKISR
jgi:hypothetical protein